MSTNFTTTMGMSSFHTQQRPMLPTSSVVSGVPEFKQTPIAGRDMGSPSGISAGVEPHNAPNDTPADGLDEASILREDIIHDVDDDPLLAEWTQQQQQPQQRQAPQGRGQHVSNILSAVDGVLYNSAKNANDLAGDQHLMEGGDIACFDPTPLGPNGVQVVVNRADLSGMTHGSTSGHPSSWGPNGGRGAPSRASAQDPMTGDSNHQNPHIFQNQQQMRSHPQPQQMPSMMYSVMSPPTSQRMVRMQFQNNMSPPQITPSPAQSSRVVRTQALHNQAQHQQSLYAQQYQDQHQNHQHNHQQKHQGGQPFYYSPPAWKKQRNFGIGEARRGVDIFSRNNYDVNCLQNGNAGAWRPRMSTTTATPAFLNNGASLLVPNLSNARGNSSNDSSGSFSESGGSNSSNSLHEILDSAIMTATSTHMSGPTDNMPHSVSMSSEPMSPLSSSSLSVPASAIRSADPFPLPPKPRAASKKTKPSQDVDTFEESVDLADPARFRQYQAEQWHDRFEDLVQFHRKHGHCLVPHNYTDNPALAQWVKRQRYQFKLKSEGRRSTLTADRLESLEALGFAWDSHQAAWDERYSELVEYHSSHGDCNVPTKYPINRQLSIWVKCQRRQYKLLMQGERTNLTKERRGQLDRLGFVWNPRNLKNAGADGVRRRREKRKLAAGETEGNESNQEQVSSV